MSLTRKEWEELWETAKDAERELKRKEIVRKQLIWPLVELVKQRVQQVIGQME